MSKSMSELDWEAAALRARQIGFGVENLQPTEWKDTPEAIKTIWVDEAKAVVAAAVDDKVLYVDDPTYDSSCKHMELATERNEGYRWVVCLDCFYRFFAVVQVYPEREAS